MLPIPSSFKGLLILAVIFVIVISSPVVFAQPTSRTTNMANQSQNLSASNSNEHELERVKMKLKAIQKELSIIKEDYVTDKKLANVKETISIELDKKLLWMTKLSTVFVIIIVMLSLSFFSLWKWFNTKLREQLQKSITETNLRHLDVRVPESSGELTDHLKKMELKGIRTYNGLDPKDCLEGCVVINISNDEDVSRFRNFLKSENPDIKHVGYVLYTGEYGKQVPGDIVKTFANTTYANSLVTLFQNIFTVGRVLKLTGNLK